MLKTQALTRRVATVAFLLLTPEVLQESYWRKGRPTVMGA